MKYIFRFDDVCPGMNWGKFLLLKNGLEKLGVRCILGVVPHCKDAKLNVCESRSDFFHLIRNFKKQGDTIAQHGTFHLYDTSSSGILKINNRSEFAGKAFEEQLSLLSYGKKILLDEDVWEPYFMAPAHSFDDVTVDVLRMLNFVAITDGYGFYPYNYRGLILVPQLTAMPLSMGVGYCTICLHTNSMTESQIASIIEFAKANVHNIIDFKEAVSYKASNSFFIKVGILMTKLLFSSYRKIRRGNILNLLNKK